MHSEEQKDTPGELMPRRLSPVIYARVAEAEVLRMGLPVYTDDPNFLIDVGPYTLVNALKLAVDKRLAVESFSELVIYFKFWTPPPLGSLRRKNRRIAAKAEVVVDEEDVPWVLVSRAR